jgi:outer membrane lipoprotein SlyB
MRVRKHVVLATVLTLLVGVAEEAGATFYSFSWNGNSFSATGTLELAGSIDVGEDFQTTDVLEFGLDLFDGGTPVASLHFPPFDLPFDTIKGTRNASSLAIEDLVVSGFAVLFGCSAGDCLSGEVFFETPATQNGLVDFGSIFAARASFVFTETAPEPGVTASFALVALALALLRARLGPWTGSGSASRAGATPAGGALSIRRISRTGASSSTPRAPSTRSS